MIPTLFLLMLLSSCASPKLVMQSDPPQAEVTVSIEGSTDKVKAGVTPFELTESQLSELLKVTPDNTQWVQLTFEKKDFQKRVVIIPTNRWGGSSRTFKIQLSPMDDPTTTVTKILKYFFNAKKFAETKQYEQAHSEVDKILALDSKMTQAMNMKAGIFFLQGNTAESRNLYKKALEIDPGSNEAIQMLEKIQNKTEGGSL